MDKEYRMKAIGHIVSDFPEKFGIPRQSGRVKSLISKIVFEPEYRNPDALRALDGFSHLWILWIFSEAITEKRSPTVRPPRLGGNKRVGVFATRSPYRPNPIGLSAVKIEKIDFEKCEITLSGGDIMDRTPIIDIKPYLPSADKIDGAVGGFADALDSYRLNVIFDTVFPEDFPNDRKDALIGILADDPRPSYQTDSDRIYGMDFAGFSVKFRVENDVGNLRVIEIERIK